MPNHRQTIGRREFTAWKAGKPLRWHPATEWLADDAALDPLLVRESRRGYA